MTKRPQALAAKSMTGFPEVYATINVSKISSNNWPLKRLNLWLLFIPWFSHAKRAACKKLLDVPLQAIVIYIFCFCVLDIYHFPNNLGHTQKLKIVTCKNERKPDHADENQKLRVWSDVHEKNKFWSRSSCIFYDGSAVLYIQLRYSVITNVSYRPVCSAGLRVGGPETRLKRWRHLFLVNRDKTFWSSLGRGYAKDMFLRLRHDRQNRKCKRVFVIHSFKNTESWENKASNT